MGSLSLISLSLHKEIKGLFAPSPSNDGKFTENTVDTAYE